MIFDSLDTAISFVTACICFFCANLLLLRRRDPGVYLPLALLFLFQGISVVLAILANSGDEVDFQSVFMRASILLGGLEIAIPFLFWLYVRALTTEGEMQSIPKLRNHIIPIVIVTLCLWTLLLFPADIVEGELEQDDPRVLGALLIALALLIGDVLFKIMICTYVYKTIRRLIAYQKRLKDVFASTENRELTWIWVIMISAGVYLIFSIGFSISVWAGVLGATTYAKEAAILDSLALLFLFWIIGIWGLRQRPGLIRSPVIEPSEPEDPPARKYEKSALNDARAERIARKIEAAMAEELLYRDPNLSLWDLAKHIGVTSHYVSQTLNTHLNSSFFDLVNGWRIKDAIEQLKATEETILVIAYDVGFNSRSAFYKAFKRETGKTPSDLRK